MQSAQIICPCHTGWPGPIPICAIPVGQCSWPKSVLCAIQVGRIRYPSVPYRLTGSDTYPCHTGRPMHLNNSSVPYRSANAVGPNHLSVPFRLAGFDTYPCHTGWPMQLAQISSPCHTGWPDLIPIRAIPVGQCSWPKSFHLAIQVGRIRCLSMPYRLANAVGLNHSSVPYRLAGSDTYLRHTGRPMQSAQIISPCHAGWPD